eukprot:scaffold204552_cov17-Prasinocladus_malaysianus.AAC.1
MASRELRVRHILVKDGPEKVEKIMQELQAGASFAGTASSLSACPSSAKGGDLGWVKKVPNPLGCLDEDVKPALSILFCPKVVLAICGASRK